MIDISIELQPSRLCTSAQGEYYLVVPSTFCHQPQPRTESFTMALNLDLNSEMFVIDSFSIYM